MVVARHAEADDGHEELGHDLAVEQQRDERLQPRHLLLHLLRLELLADFVLRAQADGAPQRKPDGQSRQPRTSLGGVDLSYVISTEQYFSIGASGILCC
jgi:hypothetical protein